MIDECGVKPRLVMLRFQNQVSGGFEMYRSPSLMRMR